MMHIDDRTSARRAPQMMLLSTPAYITHWSCFAPFSPSGMGHSREGDKTQTKESPTMGRGAKKCRSRAARYSVTLGQSPGALSPRRLSFRACPADSHRHGPLCSRLRGFFRLRAIVLRAGGSMPVTESQCSRPFRGMPGAPCGRGSQGDSVARTVDSAGLR